MNNRDQVVLRFDDCADSLVAGDELEVSSGEMEPIWQLFSLKSVSYSILGQWYLNSDVRIQTCR